MNKTYILIAIGMILIMGLVVFIIMPNNSESGEPGGAESGSSVKLEDIQISYSAATLGDRAVGDITKGQVSCAPLGRPQEENTRALTDAEEKELEQKLQVAGVQDSLEINIEGGATDQSITSVMIDGKVDEDGETGGLIPLVQELVRSACTK